MIHCFRHKKDNFDVGYYTPALTWVSKFSQIKTKLKAAQLVYFLEWGRPVEIPLDEKAIVLAESI